MIMVVDLHVLSEDAPVPDGYRGQAVERAAVVEEHVVTDLHRTAPPLFEQQSPYGTVDESHTKKHFRSNP